MPHDPNSAWLLLSASGCFLDAGRLGGSNSVYKEVFGSWIEMVHHHFTFFFFCLVYEIK
jgi:hypothetical protein